MATKAQLQAQAKYDRSHTRTIPLKLNATTDADVLARLDQTQNRQGYIKYLIRKDIGKGKPTLPTESIALLILPTVKKYGFNRVYLFGSYARNEASEESDVDLLVEGGGIETFSDYYTALTELAEAMGKPIDLVMKKTLEQDRSRAGVRFKNHVEQEKVLIYEKTD